MGNYNNNYVPAHAERASMRCTVDITTNLHVLKQSRRYTYILKKLAK